MGTKTLLQTQPFILWLDTIISMYSRVFRCLWMKGCWGFVTELIMSLGWAWAFGIEGYRVHIHQQYPCLSKLLGHHYPNNIQGSFSMLRHQSKKPQVFCFFLLIAIFLLCSWHWVPDSKMLIVTEELSISSLKTVSFPPPPPIVPFVQVSSENTMASDIFHQNFIENKKYISLPIWFVQLIKCNNWLVFFVASYQHSWISILYTFYKDINIVGYNTVKNTK